MARIRTIKPEFFWDVKIGRLSPYARLTFIGLWCLADDYGTLNMHPLVIKGQLFPFDQDVDVEACLKELEEQKLILRYGPEKMYIYIPNFKKHQKINRPSEQRQAPLPEEFGIDVEKWMNEPSVSTHDTLSESSVSTHGALSESSPKEKEMEKEKEKELDKEREGEKDILFTANAVKADTPDVVSACTNPCPHEKIISLYHEILPELPRVKVWNETRKKLLRSRWREDPERQNLEWWRKFFEYVRESDFLMGRTPPSNGRPPFQASLEWLIRPNNFAKVLEGYYHKDSPPISHITAHNLRVMRYVKEKFAEVSNDS